MHWIKNSKIRSWVAIAPGARWLKERLPERFFYPRVSLGKPDDRGAPPPPDPDRLRATYAASGLASAPDTFVLYRIIGNDLVPRHQHGQSRQNLTFILEHEPVLERCEKRFVVNRIVDPDEEQAIIRLLEDAGMPYLHLPFERENYCRQPWDVAGVPVAFAPHTARFAMLGPGWQNRIRMRLYRHKNNYVMNNNGARNTALRDGRGRAKWVLPWDGNCFLTTDAWETLKSAVIARPEVPYYLAPMVRVTDNRELLAPGTRPQADEEPQVLFRRDAALTFNSEYSYGRRPKVELFWRLGVPGPWNHWAIEPWDFTCPDYASEAGCFAEAGWVARLFSGRPALEKGPSGNVHRGTARTEAIIKLLDHLDERIVASALQPERPVFVRTGDVPGDVSEGDAELLGRLRTAAEQALERGLYSVVDKKTLPPSGDPHDYWHPAPYFWPNPLRIPGLPYVRRDGKRVPGTRLYEPLSDNYDRTRLQRMFDDGFVLALAWSHLGDERYARHAAKLVRCWFLEPDTAMNPHLEFSQVRPGHNKNRGTSPGIIEMKDLYYFLDAVRLLCQGGFLSPDECARLQGWLAEYLTWLRASAQGRRERAAGNNHGTYYDLQVGAIASFLGEHLLLRDTLRDSRFRLIEQIDTQGLQLQEMKRTNTAHYCCFNLQGWVHLAQLADSAGENLWDFEGPEGQSLKKAMEWLLPHIGNPWPNQQIETFDNTRFFPIYYAYIGQYGVSSRISGEMIPEKASIKPLFFPHDGIRPFWQL